MKSISNARIISIILVTLASIVLTYLTACSNRRSAQLEFHMVYPNYRQFLGSDGKVKSGTILPPGTAIYPSKVVNKQKSKNADNVIVYDHVDYVLMKRAELTGADLRGAGVTYNPADLEGAIQVSLEFKPEGGQKFAKLTTDFGGKTPPRQMAILLDGVVRSSPTLDEPILEGRAIIKGGFTQEEAIKLSQNLKAGGSAR